MTESVVLALGNDALLVVLQVAGPMLVTSLVVGLFISIFQAVTQIQEMTLTFIPKILAVFAVGALAGAWILGVMVSYTSALLNNLPALVR